MKYVEVPFMIGAMLRTILIVFIYSFFSISYAEAVVTVGIPPQKFIVERIGGGLVSVNVLLTSGSDPHAFSPKPSQILELSKSTLFLGVGFPFEEVVAGAAVKSMHIRYINTTGVTHNDEEGDDHEDPHLWTNPKSMLLIAENTLAALIAVDEENASYYKENFDKLRLLIDGWDGRFRELFKHKSNKKFLIYHPFLGKFAENYNLMGYVVEKGGKPPKALELKKILDTAKRENIKVFLTQINASNGEARLLSKEIGTPLSYVDILTDDWEKMMEEIYRAFASPSVSEVSLK